MTKEQVIKIGRAAVKSRIEKEKKVFIKENRRSNSPEDLLHCICYILRCPEGYDIIEWSEKIMRRITKKDL